MNIDTTHPNNPANPEHASVDHQEMSAAWYAVNGYTLEETLDNAPEGWNDAWEEAWQANAPTCDLCGGFHHECAEDCPRRIKEEEAAGEQWLNPTGSREVF